MNQKFTTWLHRWQFNHRQQQAFLEDLHALVEDGVPVGQAIETMRQVSVGIARVVASEISNGIAQGKSLADSMSNWFPRTIVEVVRAGEAAGTVEKSLQAAATTYLRQTDVRGILLNALLYPTVVIVLALVVVVFIKNRVLDTFAQIKPISVWPEVGRVLYNIGVGAEYWWWFWLLLIVLLVISVTLMLRNMTGHMRRVIDQWPLLSLYREAVAARFMEILGLLMANGMILKDALNVMHRNAEPYLSWHLMLMQYRLAAGQENVADVLATDLINKNDLVRLRVVAIGKGFEHALVSLGHRATKRNNKRIQLLGRFTGAVLLAVGALIAATIVIGIYSVGSILSSGSF